MLKNDLIKIIPGELTITINPRCINYHVGRNDVKYVNISKLILSDSIYINKIEGILRSIPTLRIKTFAIPAIHYSKPRPLNNYFTYYKISDIITHRNNFTNSKWYKKFNIKIQKNKEIIYKGKRIATKEDLDNFFQYYVLDLIDSMENEGYINDKGNRPGTVTIFKDGSIHKSSEGNHRFAVAHIIGLKKMPFIIKGVHQDWMSENVIPNSLEGIPILLNAIKNLETSNQ